MGSFDLGDELRTCFWKQVERDTVYGRLTMSFHASPLYLQASNTTLLMVTVVHTLMTSL
jgi:hypothetical protein